MANEVVITVTGKDETSGAFNSAKQGAGGLKNVLQDVGKTAAGFLTANAIGGGINLFKDQIGSVFAEARESIEVGKQTAAVLKSTGGAAGMSAGQIGDLADALSRVTNYDDDAVQSAENLLLTFTSIGKDVFPQATETVLDMSQALGQDLKSSAIQLGKAMNDPILGATALRRVGVALTEQQMDQIKAFQESGDLLSAQKIIMKELAVEFGGSARATADPLKILSNTIKNLKEQIGLALLPAVLAVAKGLSQHVVPAVAAAIKHFGNFVSLIKASLSGDLGRAALLFNELPGPLQALALVLAENKEAILGFLGGVRDAVAGVAKGIVEFAQWTQESGLLGTMLAGLQTIAVGLRAAIEALAPVVAKVAQFFKDHRTATIALGVALAAIVAIMFPIPAAILAIVFATGVLRKHWEDIKRVALDVWNSIPGPIKDALELIVAAVKYQFDTIRNIIETAINVVRGVIKTVMALIHGDWSEAWEGIKETAKALFDGVVTDITLRLSFLKTAFGIVFEGIKGIVSGAFDVMKHAAADALNWIIDKLNGVIAGINKAIDAFNRLPGPDIGSVPILSGIDTRPALGTGGGSTAPRPPGIGPNEAVSNVAHITINASGGDATAEGIAATVIRKLRDELGMETLAGPRLPVGSFSPRRA